MTRVSADAFKVCDVFAHGLFLFPPEDVNVFVLCRDKGKKTKFYIQLK